LTPSAHRSVALQALGRGPSAIWKRSLSDDVTAGIPLLSSCDQGIEDDDQLAHAGNERDAAKWLISKDLVLIGSDTWAVEVVPNPDSNLAFPVHQELLAKNGIHIPECLVTADGVYTSCYVMLPLKMKGATGSPGRDRLMNPCHLARRRTSPAREQAV